MGTPEGELREDKRSLEARSDSFTVLFFLFAFPAFPPPLLSSPQCYPPPTLQKATGQIQILDDL